MKVKDKVFVVTGGGSGVGRELVSGLLSRGARVAAADISAKALEELAKALADYGDKLSAHAADVADRESVEALPGQVIARHGAVDGVINNAGIIHPFLDVEKTGYDTAERVMGVNYFGTLAMVKSFLPYLAARPEAYIVNVSSEGALAPIPGQTAYGASKAAVKILTEGLREELRHKKIRVMTVFPGGIDSGILDNSGIETNERLAYLRKRLAFLLLTPRKAAEIILRGIERNRRRLTPGVDAALMDFLCRLCPGRGPRLIYGIISRVLG